MTDVHIELAKIVRQQAYDNLSEAERKSLEDYENSRDPLEKYTHANPMMGEGMPIVTESVYQFMVEEDKKTYDDFPDFVEIYRGCFHMEKMSNRGQSWTTNLNIAKFFAWEYNPYKEKEGRVVLKATIPKDAIYGFVNDRYEYECIVNPEELINVECHLKSKETK